MSTLDDELVGSTGRTVAGRELTVGLLFLLPALFILGVWLVYPALHALAQLLRQMRRLHRHRQLPRDVRPRCDADRDQEQLHSVFKLMLAAAIGLVFAVLTERIRFGTALKTLIFMPMAISFLAAGVIFRFVYDEDPDRGLANAMLTTVTDIWQSPGAGRCATVATTTRSSRRRPTLDRDRLTRNRGNIGIVGLRPDDVADDQQAEPAEASGDAIAGTVWLDFTRGGGGQRGEIDRGDGGPASRSRQSGARSCRERRPTSHRRVRASGLDPGDYKLRLAASNFDQPWTGFRFLGETLITPGHRLVPVDLDRLRDDGHRGRPRIDPTRDAEAARVDGASEWQVFRRVTVPLLWLVIPSS